MLRYAFNFLLLLFFGAAIEPSFRVEMIFICVNVMTFDKLTLLNWCCFKNWCGGGGSDDILIAVGRKFNYFQSNKQNHRFTI